MAEPLIKKRKFDVTGMKDQANENRVKEHLNKKTGVIAVDVDSQKGFVRVEYDLRKISFEAIEESVKELGFSLSQKIAEKFKRGMARFTEQNELDNLTATPSSCCEDPKEKINKCESCNL
jgi:copper chaperone CopZ